MPDLSFVTHIVRSLYGLETKAIESLYHGSEWRGIYRLQDEQDNLWMVRMWRSEQSAESREESDTSSTLLLRWLARRHFPAPVVRESVDGQPVAHIDGWTFTVLSYIEGDVLGAEAAGLSALAQLIGRLHTLPLDAHLDPTPARCHPNLIAIAAEQLERNCLNAPEAFRALVTNLHAAMLALPKHLPLSLVHGDCWYRNAIQRSDGSVTLIDWDLAGIGSPLLELGNLLLTSHFAFEHPLYLEVDDAKIKAIMLGYQQHCPVSPQDGESLANAMRFLLAYQLGSYVEDDSRYLHPEFPFVLQKLQARYDATQGIAEIARVYIQQGKP